MKIGLGPDTKARPTGVSQAMRVGFYFQWQKVLAGVISHKAADTTGWQSNITCLYQQAQ